MTGGGDQYNDRFSCMNVSYATSETRDEMYNTHGPERDFYERIYFDDSDDPLGPWWGEGNGGEWDHESRILALLLCAEILRR